MSTENTTLKVKISNPEKVVWEGEATSVSSENEDGPFDVLPGHANFITFSKNAPVVIRDVHGEEHSYTFDHCAFYTHNNEVKIYVDV